MKKTQKKKFRNMNNKKTKNKERTVSAIICMNYNQMKLKQARNKKKSKKNFDWICMAQLFSNPFTQPITTTYTVTKNRRFRTSCRNLKFPLMINFNSLNTLSIGKCMNRSQRPVESCLLFCIMFKQVYLKEEIGGTEK